MILSKVQLHPSFVESLKCTQTAELLSTHSTIESNRPLPWCSKQEADLANGDCISVMSQSSSLGESSNWANELFQAIAICDPQLVENLLKFGISNVRKTDLNGNTPLHICMNRFSLKNAQPMSEIAIILLKYGADANCINQDGLTPIQLAAIKGALSAVKFAVAHNLKIIKELEDEGSYKSEEEKVESLKIKVFDLQFLGGQHKESLVHFAANIGQTQMLEFLYLINMDILEMSGRGQTPRQGGIRSLIVHKLLHKYERLWKLQILMNDCECVDYEVETLKYNQILNYITKQSLQYDKIFYQLNSKNNNRIKKQSSIDINSNQKENVVKSMKTDQEKHQKQREIISHQLPPSFLNFTTLNQGISAYGTEPTTDRDVSNYKQMELTSRGGHTTDRLIKKRASFLNSSGFSSMFDGDVKDIRRSVDLQFGDVKNYVLEKQQNTNINDIKINDSCNLSESFLNNLPLSSNENNNIHQTYNKKKVLMMESNQYQQQLTKPDLDCTKQNENDQTELSQLPVEEFSTELQSKNKLKQFTQLLSVNSDTNRMVTHQQRNKYCIMPIQQQQYANVQQYQLVIVQIKQQLSILISQGSKPSNQLQYQEQQQQFKSNIEQFQKYVSWMNLVNIKLAFQDQISFNSSVLPIPLKILNYHLNRKNQNINKNSKNNLSSNNNSLKIFDIQSQVQDVQNILVEVLEQIVQRLVELITFTQLSPRQKQNEQIDLHLSCPKSKYQIFHDDDNSSQYLLLLENNDWQQQQSDYIFFIENLINLVRAINIQQQHQQIISILHKIIKLQQLRLSIHQLHYFDEQQPLLTKKKSNRLQIFDKEAIQNKSSSKQKKQIPTSSKQKTPQIYETTIICHREYHHNPKTLLDFECFQQALYSQTLLNKQMTISKSSSTPTLLMKQITNSKTNLINTTMKSRPITPYKQSSENIPLSLKSSFIHSSTGLGTSQISTNQSSIPKRVSQRSITPLRSTDIQKTDKQSKSQDVSHCQYGFHQNNNSTTDQSNVINNNAESHCNTVKQSVYRSLQRSQSQITLTSNVLKNQTQETKQNTHDYHFTQGFSPNSNSQKNYYASSKSKGSNSLQIRKEDVSNTNNTCIDKSVNLPFDIKRSSIINRVSVSPATKASSLPKDNQSMLNEYSQQRIKDSLKNKSKAGSSLTEESNNRAALKYQSFKVNSLQITNQQKSNQQSDGKPPEDKITKEKQITIEPPNNFTNSTTQKKVQQIQQPLYSYTQTHFLQNKYIKQSLPKERVAVQQGNLFPNQNQNRIAFKNSKINNLHLNFEQSSCAVEFI